MPKRPLWLYVVAVVIVLAVLDALSYAVGGSARLHTTLLVSGGFLLGMLAMYVAMHVYRWK